MIHLRLFGPVELRPEAGAPLSSGVLQPKRSAILAYLAVSPSGRARRDTLLALFWPELDDARGRKALNQSLHYLRGILGDDALISFGDEQLALSPDRVWCDAVAFDAALREGRLEEAMTLHRADFLEGMFLPDLVEFERWVEEERQRRRRAAASAAWTLADKAADSADSSEALRRAHVAAALEDQGDERGLRRLLRLYDRFGDRAGALRIYDEFARNLQEQMEVSPSPETCALVEAIRTRSAVNAPMEPLPGETPARGSPSTHSSPQPRRLRWILTGAIGGAAAITWLIGMIAAKRGSNDGPPVGLGATTTMSQAALDAFREGDRHFRSGRFAPAVEALRRAVDADSTFALAYLRLSQGANWSGGAQLSVWAVERATKHAARLEAADRRHVEAWTLYVKGEAIQAESLYREIVRADPKDVEAWSRLAEIGYHWAPMWGHSADSSLGIWRQVLELDPGNVAAAVHVARISARAGDLETVRSEQARLRRRQADAPRLFEMDALLAFSGGTAADRERTAIALSLVETGVRGELVAEVAAASPRMDGIGEVLYPALRAGRTFNSWQAGELALAAGAFLAQGRVVRAGLVLDSAALREPLRILEYRAGVATIPLVTASKDELLRLRDALGASDGAPGSEYYMARVWRLYLQGLLSVRRGERDAAARAISALEQVAARPASVNEKSFAQWFARLIGAEALRAGGKPAEALALLGEPALEPDLRLPRVWSQHRAHDRFLRGQLLEATGRYREALAWFETFPDRTAFDLPWTLAAESARTRLYRRLGEGEKASFAAKRLDSLLREADPGLRETVLRAAEVSQ